MRPPASPGPLLALALALGLAACAPAPPADEAPPQRLAAQVGPLPPMKIFGATRPAPPRRSNAEIARDFLDLTFRMESGRVLPAMTRFEGPVRVGLRGAVPPTAAPDLDKLIGRLRREAGIDIARAGRGEPVNLWVEFVTRAALQRVVPQAACFVVPRAETFAAFRRNRRSGGAEWASMTERTGVTAFIPGDVSPQEIRDCLHEELAQGLGPLNDLYRLPDSVFNDDNFHAVLTGFDMLVLRLTYAPELVSGMSEAEVAARLPALLARMNPSGQRPGAVAGGEDRDWINAIETALSPRLAPTTRRAAAGRAVTIAEESRWQDPRLAFSYFTLGRTALPREFDLAVLSYLRAGALYARPGTEIQEAHVGMQLAAFALSTGDAATAIRLADTHLPVARRAENAALLATLLLVKAEAIEAQGRADEAAAVRLDSLGWARYGFGSDAEVALRVVEIGVLRPRPVAGGEG